MGEPARPEERRLLLKIEPRTLIVPLVAAFVLVVVLQQTSSALKASGMWQHSKSRSKMLVDDPYTRIDNLLGARADAVDPATLRNPFGYGAAHAASAPTTATHHVTPTEPAPAPAPEKPVLTSIVWAAVPSATIRYDGKEFPVTENSLFADFKVTSITREQVVLDHNGETLILTIPTKGEPQ